MKTLFIRVAVFGAIFSAIVALITASVMAFGFAIAYVLTLMMNDLEMRHAITPGAVFAVFSLYFCFKFLLHRIGQGTFSCDCDECKENGRDDDEHTTEVQRPTVLRSTGTKQAKGKATHNKGVNRR